MARLNTKWTGFWILPAVLFLWCIDHLYLAHQVVSSQLAWLGQISQSDSALASDLAYRLVSPDLSLKSAGEAMLQSAGLGQGGISLLYRNLFPTVSFLCILSAVLFLFLYITALRRQQSQKWSALQDILDEFPKNNYQINSSAISDPALSVISASLNNVGEQLQKEKEALARERENSRRYTENMLHQLKTPLTGISLIQEWLCDSETDPDRQELLVQCGRKIQDMRAKLQELLYELKLSSADRRIYMKRQNLSPMFREIPMILGEQLTARQMHLNMTCPEECNAVADSFWLKEAVLNLCKNAIDHSAENSSISLTVSIDVSSLVIKVRDGGTGINTDLKSHLFERYASGSDSIGSSGIGLNLAYDIIHRHGGSLLLEEHDGPGAWFLIRIPQLPGK